MAVKKETTKRRVAAKRPEKIEQTEPQKIESPREERLKRIKQRVKTRSFIVGALAVLGLLLAILFRGQFIVATVNGEPISRFTLINELEKEAGARVMESLVTKKLILQEAKKKNVNVSNGEIDEEVKRVEKTLKDQGQDLDAALSQQGMTRDQFKEQVVVQLTLKKLVADKAKVTDKEVNEYLEKNKDNLPKEMGEKELKEAVKGQLEQQKFSQAAGDLVNSLKASGNIKYYRELK